MIYLLYLYSCKAIKKCTRQESNLHQWRRRPSFYPLDYECILDYIIITPVFCPPFFHIFAFLFYMPPGLCFNTAQPQAVFIDKIRFSQNMMSRIAPQVRNSTVNGTIIASLPQPRGRSSVLSHSGHNNTRNPTVLPLLLLRVH